MSMFFCRLGTFSRKQSFEVDILSSSKKLHISRNIQALSLSSRICERDRQNLREERHGSGRGWGLDPRSYKEPRITFARTRGRISRIEPPPTDPPENAPRRSPNELANPHFRMLSTQV